MSKVYIILGPTSSGKTSLALKLANDFNGEIISVDSRQMYTYMDIGTGKLPIKSDIKIEKQSSHWIMNGIPVWGYDLVAPDKFFSAYDFSVFALEKAKDLLDMGKNVFLVGGTGFYIDIFTNRVTPSNTEPDFELRSNLEKLSLRELQKKAEALSIIHIDINNPVRLIRSIENSIGNKKNLNPLPYLEDVEFIYIGLIAPNSYLYERADLWVDTIWKNGLVNEVKNLLSLGFGNSLKLQGLVYKTVISFLSGEVDQPTAMQLIKYDIHAYIRRQLTYFKRNKSICWFDISTGDYIQNVYNLVNG